MARSWARTRSTWNRRRTQAITEAGRRGAIAASTRDAALTVDYYAARPRPLLVDARLANPHIAHIALVKHVRHYCTARHAAGRGLWRGSIDPRPPGADCARRRGRCGFFALHLEIKKVAGTKKSPGSREVSY